MRVAILLPETNCFPDLEQHVFDFTNRLGRYCASITSCSIAIEPAPAQSSRQPDFAVKLTLQVFGETLQLIARAPTQASDDALTRALEEIFHQALARLEPISQNHSGCGCGLGTEICAPSNCKGN